MTITARDLTYRHLGRTVTFRCASGHTHTGRLDAVYAPGPGLRTLTVDSHRHRGVRASTPITIEGEPNVQ